MAIIHKEDEDRAKYRPENMAELRNEIAQLTAEFEKRGGKVKQSPPRFYDSPTEEFILKMQLKYKRICRLRFNKHIKQWEVNVRGNLTTNLFYNIKAVEEFLAAFKKSFKDRCKK